MNELQERIHQVETQIELLKNEHERCEAMSQTLYGNGREGIVTTVSKLEQSIKALIFWIRALVLALVPVLAASLIHGNIF